MVGFIRLVTEKYVSLSDAKKKVLRRKMKNVRIKYPHAIELKLTKLLIEYNKKLSLSLMRWIENNEKRWNRDSWENEILVHLNIYFEQELETMLNDPKVIGIDIQKQVEKLFILLYSFNKAQFMKIIKDILGESYYGSEMWWDNLRKQWNKVFYERTKKVAYGFVDKIKDIIYKGIQKNREFSEILSDIKKANKTFTIKKANFIARDLIGSANSLFQKNMHTSIGIDMYTWQTMVDERVRGRPGGKYPTAVPSHWAMEGLVCSWYDPIVYSEDGMVWKHRTSLMPKAQVGEEYACRCLPVPYFATILNQIDRGLI